MKKIIYITNIPTPYRQKRFNILNKILQKKGFNLEVLYMASIEPNRSWIVPENTFNYNYKIYCGIHPQIGGIFAHFNPGLLIRLLKNDYECAVIGGMASPTHWLSPYFINSNKLKILSIESNMYSVNRKSGVAAWVKKNLLSKADVFQVTGNPQIDYIKYFTEKINQPIIKLPNLIDEDVFVDKVSDLKLKRESLRKSLNIGENVQAWIIPARLTEDKGILEFLSALVNIKKKKSYKIFIIGDGHLKIDIENFVKKYDLPVKLTGFIQQNKIIEYYAAADLFVLPSFQDPSPLTPIEAIASGLPILMSSRIGNIEDVLDLNGWSFDPQSNIDDRENLINLVINNSLEDLQSMGKISKKIFKEKFDSKKNIDKYVNQILTLLNE